MYEYTDQLQVVEHTGYINNGQGLHNTAIGEVHEEEPQKKTYASIVSNFNLIMISDDSSFDGQANICSIICVVLYKCFLIHVDVNLLKS